MRRGAPARRPPLPPSSETGTLALRAWVRVLAMQKRVAAAIRGDLDGEMTMPRFDLLANLTQTDGQTLAALSRSMRVTAGNITGLVDRAARDGMVERRADPGDRRAWRVHVTAKGQRAFREAERRHAAKVAKLFAGLSSSELETFIHLLDKLPGLLRPADRGAPWWSPPLAPVPEAALGPSRKVLVKPQRARPSPAKPRKGTKP